MQRGPWEGAPEALTWQPVPALSTPLIVAPASGALNHTSSEPLSGAGVDPVVVVGVGVGVTVTVFDTLIDTCEVALSPCASYATAFSTWVPLASLVVSNVPP